MTPGKRHAITHWSLNHSIRYRRHVGWDCQTDLFGGIHFDDLIRSLKHADRNRQADRIKWYETVADFLLHDVIGNRAAEQGKHRKYCRCYQQGIDGAI